MEFRTQTKPLEGLKGTVSHAAPILLVGSCFSDNIGAELRADLFDVIVNPFGPLYNPLSIARAIDIIIAGCEDDNSPQLFEHDGLWRDWNFHSRYAAPTPGEATRLMTRSVAAAHDALPRASAIILTLGTTTAYRLAETGQVVANCHKMPAAMFDRTELNLDETIGCLDRAVRAIREVNTEAKIIFTVSPLRYLSDGMHANTIIKATLHLAIDAVMRRHDRTIYFPAYEIMNDDLRDYRFYADDMKHPSAMAVRYIYDLFSQSFFTPATLGTASAGRRLSRRLGHRSFSGAQTEIKELDLLRQYPELVDGYKRFIENEL